MAFIREYEEPRGEHALCRVLRNKALIVTGVRDENEHAQRSWAAATAGAT